MAAVGYRRELRLRTARLDVREYFSADTLAAIAFHDEDRHADSIPIGSAVVDFARCVHAAIEFMAPGSVIHLTCAVRCDVPYDLGRGVRFTRAQTISRDQLFTRGVAATGARSD